MKQTEPGNPSPGATGSAAPVIGRVVALAVKPAAGAAMRECDVLELETDGSVVGGAPASVKRGVTILSSQQWETVQCELNAAIPWTARRANVLIDCEKFSHLLGRRLCIGGAEVVVEGETRPCDEMDRQHPGLLKALVPEMRGGVHARVIRGGAVRTGDQVALVSIFA